MTLLTQRILPVLLCIILVISGLLFLAGLLLSRTLFGSDYYYQVIADPAYLPLVRQAIGRNLQQQSSYTGIPLATLQSGLDDTTLYMLQRRHVENVIDFLHFRADYSRPVYPDALFYDELLAFMDSYAAETGITVSESQLSQLAEVAADSAAIVSRHIAVFDLGLVKDMTVFQQVHRIAVRMTRLLRLAWLVWLAAAAALVLINPRQWRDWTSKLLISLWITGSLLFVPSLILQITALHQRLAIETAYLRFVLNRLLAAANNMTLAVGLFLFLAATAGLIVLYFVRPARQPKATR